MIASGDLTHRGTARRSTQRGRGFLRGLGPPVLAIPGNHDIPYTFPARFTRTWTRVRAAVGDDRAGLLAAERCTSSGSTRCVPGGTSPAGSRRAAHARSATSCAGAGRRAPRRRAAPPSDRRAVALAQEAGRAPNHVLAALVDAGAELIVAGHIHQGAGRERHEFEVLAGDERGVVVSIAPGLGQPRPNGAARRAAASSTSSTRRSLRSRDVHLARRRTGRSRPSGPSPRGREPLTSIGLDRGRPRAAMPRPPDERDEHAATTTPRMKPSMPPSSQAGDRAARRCRSAMVSTDRHRVAARDGRAARARRRSIRRR